jgi:outer membrane biosynthesis protein TonB
MRRSTRHPPNSTELGSALVDKNRSIKVIAIGGVAALLIAGAAFGADAVLRTPSPARTVVLAGDELATPEPTDAAEPAATTEPTDAAETAEPTETPEPAELSEPAETPEATRAPKQPTSTPEATNDDHGGQSGHDGDDANDDHGGDDNGGDD